MLTPHSIKPADEVLEETMKFITVPAVDVFITQIYGDFLLLSSLFILSFLFPSPPSIRNTGWNSTRNVSKSCFKSFWVVKGEQEVLLVWIYLTLGIVVVGVPDHVIRKCSDRCLFIFISALLRFGLVIHCIHCVFPTQPSLGFRILL